MRYPTIPSLLLSSLLFLTTPINAQNNCLGDKSKAGYCTPLTYEDTTSLSALTPTAAQCQETCVSINSEAGDWLVDFSSLSSGKHAMLVKPCGFAVSPGDGTPSNANMLIANQDILDVYDESLKRFGSLHAGRVSARGTMLCGDYMLNWFIEEPSA